MKKVLVALSGGVDSAVAAYLLKEQGYQVSCAFMRNWDSVANHDLLGNPIGIDEICPQEVDYNDAKRVSQQLGCELFRVDFVQEYWQDVFAVFIEETKKGRTPNPDILCNKHIKFAAFYDYALKQGFEWVATGHYASVDHSVSPARLKRGKDNLKDQSYFLVQVPQSALQRTIFPLGDLTKEEVRDIAKKQNFYIAEKKDSTGICFIGERHFREFLHNYIPKEPGEIIDIDSRKTIGQHHGVMFYTIGQRKGLGIGGTLGPWFVVGKDEKKNRLYVGAGFDNPWLFSDGCIVERMNWFDKLQDKPIHCTAKFRYRQKDNPVIIEHQHQQLIVKYPQKISSVTVGQEAVFYQNDLVLGGGVIAQVTHQGFTFLQRLERGTP